jgi:hypothetical protein
LPPKIPYHRVQERGTACVIYCVIGIIYIELQNRCQTTGLSECFGVSGRKSEVAGCDQIKRTEGSLPAFIEKKK